MCNQPTQPCVCVSAGPTAPHRRASVCISHHFLSLAPSHVGPCRRPWGKEELNVCLLLLPTGQDVSHLLKHKLWERLSHPQLKPWLFWCNSPYTYSWIYLFTSFSCHFSQIPIFHPYLYILHRKNFRLYLISYGNYHWDIEDSKKTKKNHIILLSMIWVKCVDFLKSLSNVADVG